MFTRLRWWIWAKCNGICTKHRVEMQSWVEERWVCRWCAEDNTRRDIERHRQFERKLQRYQGR